MDSLTVPVWPVISSMPAAEMARLRFRSTTTRKDNLDLLGSNKPGRLHADTATEGDILIIKDLKTHIIRLDDEKT